MNHPARLTATLAAAALAVAILPATTGAAFADDEPAPAPTAAIAATAEEALSNAVEALDTDPATTPAGDPAADTTLALLDLSHQLPDLDTTDRRQARALLARPDGTNGTASDVSAARWTTAERQAAKSTCDDAATYGDNPFCIHWVPAGTLNNGVASKQIATDDAVAKTVQTMKTVWSTEIGTLGYHAPPGDGHLGESSALVGPSDRLDVYLADAGAANVYGYAVPESNDESSYGYLVLDNDFSAKQFPSATTTSDEARDVTAAHEFFHLVQFGYDSWESAWLMESTATWMEERVYDAINDNRQYIASGSLRWPGQSLDTFDPGSGAQYGTWVFHELVGQRLGVDTIRKVWVAATKTTGDSATGALSLVLKGQGSSLANEFRAFSGAAMAPAHFWSEGGAYPSAVISHAWPLGRAKPSTGTQPVWIDHLASADFRFRPRAGLTAKTWRLRLTVDGPSTGGTAYVLVRYRDGHVATYPLSLDSSGNVAKSFPFSFSTVRRIKLAVGNASQEDGRKTTFSARVYH